MAHATGLCPRFALGLFVAAVASTVFAQDHGGHATPYAGLEQREIASLSETDIADLRRGAGWGLALPAELNGWPGPMHLLELANALDLTDAQVKEIEGVEEQMRSAAIAAGDRFLAAEASLDDAFASGDLDQRSLQELIEQAAAARAALRLAHLAAHLRTPEILTDAQIERYAILRGYKNAGCDTPPAGHDPAMWRRHNRCE